MRVYKKDDIILLDVEKDEFFYIKSESVELRSEILEVFEEDQTYNFVDYVENIIHSGIKDFKLYNDWHISIIKPTVIVEDGEITLIDVGGNE